MVCRFITYCAFININIHGRTDKTAYSFYWQSAKSKWLFIPFIYFEFFSAHNFNVQAKNISKTNKSAMNINKFNYVLVLHRLLWQHSLSCTYGNPKVGNAFSYISKTLWQCTNEDELHFFCNGKDTHLVSAIYHCKVGSVTS